MLKDYHIQIISAKDTYTIRHPILRKGRPIEDCYFIGDHLASTYHFGIIHHNKLIGVVSFMLKTTPLIKEKFQYQLRGMAILKPYQRKGLGKLLIHAGVSHLKKLNINLIWCHARETAVPFYKKNGFEVVGQSFNIPKIGIHYSMYKKIN